MPVPSANPPVERRSLREVAVERIRTAIFDGTLEPGEHLNDGELQSWLGISRTPIREALNDLARVGLIEMAAQRYTRVALPDPAQRTEVMQTLGAMLGGVVRVTVPGLSDGAQGLSDRHVFGVSDVAALVAAATTVARPPRGPASRRARRPAR